MGENMYNFWKNSAQILLSIIFIFSCSNSICMHRARMKNSKPSINRGKKRPRQVFSESENPATKKARLSSPNSNLKHKPNLDKRIASMCVKTDNSICDHTEENQNPLLCQSFKTDKNFDIEKEYVKATEQWTNPERILNPAIERILLLQSIETNTYDNTPPTLEYLPDFPYNTNLKVRRKKASNLSEILAQTAHTQDSSHQALTIDCTHPKPSAFLIPSPLQPFKKVPNNTPNQAPLPKPDFSCFASPTLKPSRSLSSSD